MSAWIECERSTKRYCARFELQPIFAFRQSYMRYMEIFTLQLHRFITDWERKKKCLPCLPYFLCFFLGRKSLASLLYFLTCTFFCSCAFSELHISSIVYSFGSSAPPSFVCACVQQTAPPLPKVGTEGGASSANGNSPSLAVVRTMYSPPGLLLTLVMEKSELDNRHLAKKQGSSPGNCLLLPHYPSSSFDLPLSLCDLSLSLCLSIYLPLLSLSQ